MKPTVYLDSTVSSYHVEPVTEGPIFLARHLITRRWWAKSGDYKLYVSGVVLDEVKEGQPERAAQRLDLLKPLQVLGTTPEVITAAEFYVRHFAMPRANTRDAFHLAFASVYRIQFLLTWNLAHLANPRKRRHIEALNLVLGHPTPVICTPEGLLAETSPEV